MILKLRRYFDVDGSCFHVAPPSTDFQTPFPYTASALLVASPVAKYMICGLDGSWQIEDTAMLEKRSLIGCQLGIVESMLVHFQSPPAIPPAKTVLPVGSFKVSSNTAAILPDV